MSDNKKGLQIEITGESHSDKIKLVLKGIKEGETIDLDALQNYIHRRAAHGDGLSTARTEDDLLHITGGIENGAVTGDITAYVNNTAQSPKEYDNLRNLPRPSHADYPAMVKDDADLITGGGRFSGRLTVMTVAAGGIATQILQKRGIISAAHLLCIGNICDTPFDYTEPQTALLQRLVTQTFPVIDPAARGKMQDEILRVKALGDSVGGVVEYKAAGLPVGLGDNLCNGLESAIAWSVFGVPAVKGIEFGAGFSLSKMLGSTANDRFAAKDGKIVTVTNNSGGILGGMANGMPLVFCAAVKPTPSISLPQKTVNLKTLKEQTIQINGRHDPCIVPRAAIAVEAAANTAILDLMIKEGRI